jgi:hypothetical protein
MGYWRVFIELLPADVGRFGVDAFVFDVIDGHVKRMARNDFSRENCRGRERGATGASSDG